jgi:hypothetical protein
MPDDHSDVVPLLPIPNRKVKRVCADDSADPRVKVGHRQAITAREAPPEMVGLFRFWISVRVLFSSVRRRPDVPTSPHFQ